MMQQQQLPHDVMVAILVRLPAEEAVRIARLCAGNDAAPLLIDTMWERFDPESCGPAGTLLEWSEHVSPHLIKNVLARNPSRLRECARKERERLSEAKFWRCKLADRLEDFLTMDVREALASTVASDRSSFTHIMAQHVFDAQASSERKITLYRSQTKALNCLVAVGLRTADTLDSFQCFLLDLACFHGDLVLMHEIVADVSRDERRVPELRKVAAQSMVSCIDADAAAGNEAAICQRVRFLVEVAGADPNYSDEDTYFTPISKACREGLLLVARLLRRYGASLHVDEENELHDCLKMARFSEKPLVIRFVITEQYRRGIPARRTPVRVGRR